MVKQEEVGAGEGVEEGEGQTGGGRRGGGEEGERVKQEEVGEGEERRGRGSNRGM